MSDLLRSALILDTETLGLTRGSPIHEIAIYNLETREAYEYIMKPRNVSITGNSLQDLAKFSATSGDKHIAKDFLDWQAALQHITEIQTKAKIGSLDTADKVRQAIEVNNPWFAKMLYGSGGPAYPHVLGIKETRVELQARHLALGDDVLKYNRVNNIPIEAFLAQGGEFEKVVKPGSTVWIANAAFESKQLGAQLGAMGKGAIDAFKSRLETRSEYADPLYVTGKEINQARVGAQLTGDWTRVWKAYKQYTPKANEVAVRDIQDVTRAIMSYGRKLGFTKVATGTYFGSSIDLQYRLLGSLEENPAEAMKKLLFEEKHRALEDAAKSEHYVLRKSVHYAQVLEDVSEGTTRGRELLKEAAIGKGDLHKMLNYFQRFEEVAPILQRGYALQRLERGYLDIINDGATYQVSGYDGVHNMTQYNSANQMVEVPRVRYSKQRITDMDSLVSFLKANSHYETYGIDLESEVTKMKEFVNSNKGGTRTTAQLVSEYVQRENSQAVESYFKGNAQRLLQMDITGAATRMQSRYGAKIWKEGLHDGIQALPELGRGFAAAAIGIAAVGAIWNLLGGPNSSVEDRRGESLITMNYDEWATARAMTEQGFAPTGMAHQYRKMRTDFGSPYQGITGTQTVLLQQELLREREKKLRAQYGASQTDPMNGLFGIFSPFKEFYNPGYTFFNEGRPIEQGELPGIKNRKGMQVIDVNPGDWKVEVEDVDTIMLKRKGLVGAVSDFFGLAGASYTFRLEGIDSTEIWHGMGDDAWHVPQPGATKATEAMKALLENRTIQIAYDPSQSTYGRQVGQVYSDGKNLNLEAVRRGLASHLPYGKESEAHTDWVEYGHAEEQAFRSNRGLWENPWAQVYHQFGEVSGERITFNTFARKDKIAENFNTMQLLGVMEDAQAAGAMNSNHIALTNSIGKSWSEFGDPSHRFFMEGHNQSHYNNYMNELLADTNRFMATQGTNRNPHKLESTRGIGELNSYLALDTMGGTNSVWSRRQLEAFSQYGAVKANNNERKRRMADAQQQINQQFGRSPIGHYRM